ncbi:MAG TPA: hypothetical protein VFE50_19470 [Cyclobacteriaceae bacterium]|nr:hypothetical protein [Cyclobacteriaceae bacterium]
MKHLPLLLLLISAISTASSTCFSQSLKPSQYSITHHYTGVIGGKYKFLMNLFFDKEKINGEYRYYTQKSFLQVDGTYDATTKKFNLTESIYDYKKQAREVTGYFEGIRNGNAVTGKWYNKDRKKSFDFVLSTDEKPLQFKTISDNATVADEHKVINKIVVAFPNKTQTIEGFESDVFADLGEAISLEDINFDGYLDLMVIEFTGARNTPYLYWTYDPKKIEFIKHEELTASNPVIDVQKQRVVSDWVDGAATYGHSEFVYQDGKYYLAEESETDLSTDKTVTKKFKVVNGESVEVKP